MKTCDGTGLAPFGDAVIGRICTSFPFTCGSPDCDCPSAGCLSCTVEGASEATCLTCAPGRLLLGGSCLKAATCKGGKVMGSRETCKCSGSCSMCKLVGVVGGSGVEETCIVCKKSAYLADGECLTNGSDCPAGTVPMGVSAEGRFCSEPFLCTRGKRSTTGQKCKCEAGKNCASCR